MEGAAGRCGIFAATAIGNLNAQKFMTGKATSRLRNYVLLELPCVSTVSTNPAVV